MTVAMDDKLGKEDDIHDELPPEKRFIIMCRSRDRCVISCLQSCCSNETTTPRKRKLTSSTQLRESLECIVSEINTKRKRDSDKLDGTYMYAIIIIT